MSDRRTTSRLAAVSIAVLSTAAMTACGGSTGPSDVSALGAQSASSQDGGTTTTVDPERDESSDPSPGDETERRTVSSVPDPPPGQTGPAPTGADLEPRLENRNRRDGRLGTLCWARWEVARTLLSGLRGQDEADQAIRNLETRLSGAASAVQGIKKSLSAEMQSFAERFSSDLEAARDVLSNTRGESAESRLSKVGAVFDFEDYPSARQYAESAEAHDACANP